jgi:hypothetical protein
MNDNRLLQTLEQHRDLILLAEIGALIHDIGKLSEKFIGTKGANTPSEKRWLEDVHCEVVQAHATCIVPSALAPYLLTDANVNVEVARQSVTQMVGDALRAAFSETDPSFGQLLADLAERRLSGAANTKGIKDRLNLLYRRDRKGQIQSTLLADLESRFGKGSQKARACAAQLETAWPMIEPVMSNQIAWLSPFLAHENRLRRESLIQLEFLPPQLKQALAGQLPDDHSNVRLKDFIEMHHGWHWDIPYLLQLLRAKGEEEDDESKEGGDTPEGCDGLDSFIDKGQLPKKGAEQDFAQTFIATAFGYEPESLCIRTDGLKKVRHDYADDLALILQHIQTERANLTTDHKLPPEFWREVLYDGWQTADGHTVEELGKLTKTTFCQALGETRRAANDVTLWDHCYSTASLYKAALAKVLLEKALDEKYEFPPPSAIGWRFLRVGVDGMSFFGQAHHVPDILARQQVLTRCTKDLLLSIHNLAAFDLA